MNSEGRVWVNQAKRGGRRGKENVPEWGQFSDQRPSYSLLINLTKIRINCSKLSEKHIRSFHVVDSCLIIGNREEWSHFLLVPQSKWQWMAECIAQMPVFAWHNELPEDILLLKMCFSISHCHMSWTLYSLPEMYNLEFFNRHNLWVYFCNFLVPLWHLYLNLSSQFVNLYCMFKDVFLFSVGVQRKF